MKHTITIACTILKSIWQAVFLRSALTALLLAPLAALHAAEKCKMCGKRAQGSIHHSFTPSTNTLSESDPLTPRRRSPF
jgi:hypothetical protein